MERARGEHFVSFIYAVGIDVVMCEQQSHCPAMPIIRGMPQWWFAIVSWRVGIYIVSFEQ